jgi:nucleotide-binding universal stress UspA family protein
MGSNDHLGRRLSEVPLAPIPVEADGPVWKVVTEAADRNDAAVIVMGSRGHT